MEKLVASKCVSLLKASISKLKGYDVICVIQRGERISDFHQWADRKRHLGVFEVKRKQGKNYFIAFIDWQEKQNYYIVIFPENVSGPIAELHAVDTIGDRLNLCWSYSPTKRDGKNMERKNYFKKYFLDTEVQIALPLIPDDVEMFLDELFGLCENRLKADVLDVVPPDSTRSFPEGKVYEKVHKTRERNQKLIQLAKENTQNLACQVCGFDFKDKYGEIGIGFIEVHHTIPVCELREGELTRVEDLALVCSNCHSMLHRRRPWLKMDQLKELLKSF